MAAGTGSRLDTISQAASYQEYIRRYSLPPGHVGKREGGLNEKILDRVQVTRVVPGHASIFALVLSDTCSAISLLATSPSTSALPLCRGV
ncbi:unnamed protein product [Knipowitschia caucasica]|uniref:Uncharacterized protein n=1 Tax=Knipowitschia caucasica TaxID=637954 RepID=A0AAV2LN52_KNICA